MANWGLHCRVGKVYPGPRHEMYGRAIWFLDMRDGSSYELMYDGSLRYNRPIEILGDSVRSPGMKAFDEAFRKVISDEPFLGAKIDKDRERLIPMDQTEEFDRAMKEQLSGSYVRGNQGKDLTGLTEEEIAEQRKKGWFG